MGDVIRAATRARQATNSEWRFRGRQLVATWNERALLATRRMLDGEVAPVGADDWQREAREHPSAKVLLQHFRGREGSRFFRSFDDRATTVAAHRARFGPTPAAVLIDRAERSMDGRFDLLGHRDVSCGDPVDWHRDPSSGLRLPLIHWSRLVGPRGSTGVDRKLLWELNRHQAFVMLGRAYWLTDDERYADAFAKHIDGWMRTNPPMAGHNWSSSLEVSLRAISWLWALHFFRDSPALTPELFRRILGLLYHHGRHIETYLSTYFSPNTHLTGEALGLFYLGTVWPELSCAARWRTIGIDVLSGELERQVTIDGVHFERSEAYHRYTTDFCLHAITLAAATDQELEPIVADQLHALLGHIASLTRPDGSMPAIGDDDGGTVLPLDDRQYTDVRATLSTGAVVLQRSDLKFVAGHVAESTLWMLGAQGLLAYDALPPSTPPVTSHAFRDGGVVVMRDEWSPRSSILAMSCSAAGRQNAAHVHADTLGIDLTVHGRPVLVDPGTFSYDRSPGPGDAFRGTEAHNTVTVDGKQASSPTAPFRWTRVASGLIQRWYTHPRFDFLEAEHDGYRHLHDPVSHVRSVWFLKGDYWIIRDRMQARTRHRYDVRFHLAPDACPHIASEGLCIESDDSARTPLLLVHVAASAGSWSTSPSPVSRRYGSREAAIAGVFSSSVTGPHDIVTFLVPPRADGSKPTIRRVAANRGLAYEVSTADHTDLLLVADGAQGNLEGLTSDFRWTWIRRSVDAIDDEVVALDGSVFTAPDVGYRTSSGPVGVVGKRSTADGWSFDVLPTDPPSGAEGRWPRCAG